MLCTLFLHMQCENEESAVTPVSGPVPEVEPEDEPCFKRFKHLSTIVSEKLKQLQQISRGTTPENSPQKQQMEKYLNEVIPFKEDADILDFWVDHEQSYPSLADVAFDVLTIPASSAPDERVFPQLGLYPLARETDSVEQNLRERC